MVYILQIWFPFSIIFKVSALIRFRQAISHSLIGWGCFGCSQLSASSAHVPTGNLPSRAPASPLIAFRNSLMLVISFVRPMSARMCDTSQLHSESRRPAEWQSAWGAVPKPRAAKFQQSLSQSLRRRPSHRRTVTGESKSCVCVCGEKETKRKR